MVFFKTQMRLERSANTVWTHHPSRVESPHRRWGIQIRFGLLTGHVLLQDPSMITIPGRLRNRDGTAMEKTGEIDQSGNASEAQFKPP